MPREIVLRHPYNSYIKGEHVTKCVMQENDNNMKGLFKAGDRRSKLRPEIPARGTRD